MLDITLERPGPIGDDEPTLVEFEAAQKLTNVPQLGHAMVTTADGEQEKVPCATVVSVEPTDESSDDEAN